MSYQPFIIAVPCNFRLVLGVLSAFIRGKKFPISVPREWVRDEILTKENRSTRRTFKHS